jgi:hypothetical protein
MILSHKNICNHGLHGWLKEFGGKWGKGQKGKRMPPKARSPKSKVGKERKSRKVRGERYDFGLRITAVQNKKV